jgi:hypothetical protein
VIDMQIPHSLPRLAAVLLATTVASTGAQAQAAATQPGKPSGDQPAYPSDNPSAFAGFKPFGQTAVADWVQVNRRVAEVGGWRAYAQEAQAPAPAQPAQPAASAAEPRPADAHHHHLHHDPKGVRP